MIPAHKDIILRAQTADGSIRAFAGDLRQTVNEAQRLHQTSPLASAALGRTLVAASIMGLMCKNEEDLISINVKGDGPLGGILATADSKGQVKGYVVNPQIDLPLKENGKLDVSGALGHGHLSVIKDLGLKEPYAGQIPLISGEIAEDIAYYFTQSEQTPSAVALGILVDIDYSIRQAGGFVLQMMPGADPKVAAQLEDKLSSFPPVTTLLDSGKTPEHILQMLLGEFGLEILDAYPVGYYCNCTRERVEKALISIGRADLTKILEEDRQAELHCHFCNQTYHFDENALKNLLHKI